MARFSHNCPAGGLTCSFNSNASSDPDGTIVGFAWDFNGDGSVDSNERNPSHTYSAAGTYTVTLLVIDNSRLSDDAQQQVMVPNG